MSLAPERDSGNGAEAVNEAPSKRLKMSGTKLVLLSCFDDPERPVEADTSLLESVGCRLSVLIKHSEQEVLQNGKLAFKVGNTMTRVRTIDSKPTLLCISLQSTHITRPAYANRKYYIHLHAHTTQSLSDPQNVYFCARSLCVLCPFAFFAIIFAEMSSTVSGPCSLRF